MKMEDLKDAFGPTPASFRGDLNKTLERLEPRPVTIRQRRSRARLPALAACLAVVLLAGTAFAAVRLGIFDQQLSRDAALSPLSGAEALVETGLAQVENDLVRVQLEEALFDGRRLMLLTRLSPQDPSLRLMDWRTVRELSGEENVLAFDLDLNLDQQVLYSDCSFQVEEDGSTRLWCEYTLAEDGCAEVSGSLPICLVRPDGKQTAALDPLPFSLRTIAPERLAELQPQGDDEIEGLRLISARICSTPVRGLIILEFACPEMLSLRFLDGNGQEFPITCCVITDLTSFPRPRSEASPAEETIWRLFCEIPALEELPETVEIQVSRMGEPLGALRCRTVPET